jgi:hypothetical protein
MHVMIKLWYLNPVRHVMSVDTPEQAAEIIARDSHCMVATRLGVIIQSTARSAHYQVGCRMYWPR